MGKTLPWEMTTRLTARALGISSEALKGALRPATMDELPDIVDFRRQWLGAVVRWNDSTYLPWRYHLGRQNAGFGELWTVRRDGELLGIVGSETMDCTDGTRTLRGHRLMDILVRPDLADSGLGAWLNQAMFERTDFTIAVGANGHSKGLVTRLFTPLAPMRDSVHPLHWRPFLAQSRLPSGFRKVLARGGGAAMGAWATALRMQPSHGLELRRVESFEEGPGLLPPCALRPAGAVQFVRSGAYLNRRLLDNPRVRVETWGAYRGGRRTGYIAWLQCERPNRAPELHIVDWHAGPDRPLASWGALLRAAIVTARQRGCSAVRLTSQPDGLPPLRRRHGFFDPPAGPAVIVALHQAPEATPWHELNWALNGLCDDGNEH